MHLKSNFNLTKYFNMYNFSPLVPLIIMEYDKEQIAQKKKRREIEMPVTNMIHTIVYLYVVIFRKACKVIRVDWNMLPNNIN